LKSQNINELVLQATRSAADDKIGILMAGILRLAKRRSAPLTPRPAKMYGPFFSSSNSIARAVPRDVDVLVFTKKNSSEIQKIFLHTVWVV
jgi:hypothetical protein